MAKKTPSPGYPSSIFTAISFFLDILFIARMLANRYTSYAPCPERFHRAGLPRRRITLLYGRARISRHEISLSPMAAYSHTSLYIHMLIVRMIYDITASPPTHVTTGSPIRAAAHSAAIMHYNLSISHKKPVYFATRGSIIPLALLSISLR